MNWITGRAGAIALLCSVALNLVLVSAVAVHFYRGVPGPRPGMNAMAGGGFEIDRMAARLPEADGKVLKQAFESRSGDIKAAQAALRDASGAVRKALTAEPFEAKAVDAAMAKVTQERMQMQQALQGVFATAAAEMSKEGRERLARRSVPREPGRDGERRGPAGERNR